MTEQCKRKIAVNANSGGKMLQKDIAKILALEPEFADPLFQLAFKKSQTELAEAFASRPTAHHELIKILSKSYGLLRGHAA